jgi:hypothetical protein
MGSEGIIEITDFYLAIAADRVSAMTTAAARNLHCKKSELLDWRDGLRRLGLRVVGDQRTSSTNSTSKTARPSTTTGYVGPSPREQTAIAKS